MEKLIGINEVSALTGYAVYTIRYFVRKGKLKAYRHAPESHMKFKKSDVKKFLRGTALKKSSR